MKKNKLIIISLTAAALLVGGSYLVHKQVSAATSQQQTVTGTDGSYEFAGSMSIQEVCCNGLVYKINEGIGGGVTGSFIFPWTNMIPIYQIGIGLYKYWTLADGNIIAGDATKGGTCITIASECESDEDVDYTTKKAGIISKSGNSVGK